MLELLKAFSKYWDVVLGLNHNEATILFEVLGHTASQKVEFNAETIYNALSINTLIIHEATQAIAVDAEGVHKQNSNHIQNPKISTGAGDNFNAGFCIGKLLNLHTLHCLQLAHASSAYYMTTGQSPQPNDIIQAFQN
jgi:fructose-1-phosphate kinase PfkB-like protein